MLLAVLVITLAAALACCDGGGSKCSATNPCVDGYICNKNGGCTEGAELSIDTNELLDAYMAEPYELPLQASGGIPPYHWSVQSDLPWLEVEEVGADVWALTGTPNASTPPDGATIAIDLHDNSLDGGNLAPKDLKLIVHECVEGRKQNCYLPQAGVCVGGNSICTNNTWGSCDVSTGPSDDIENCGVDCTPCGPSADKCVGGLCACGDGSPCTGDLICCFGVCVDDVECGTCGDGVQDEWEDCDKLNVGEETCLTLNYYGGQLRCLDDCSFDLAECEAAGWCGDTQINGQEDCDGTELGTSTCETFGYHPGVLSCTQNCKYDTSDCCGDGATGPNEGCDDQNQEPWDGCNACEISEFIINTNTAPDQLGSSVAMNDSGQIVVAWDSWDQDGSGCGVFGQTFDSIGAPLADEFQINTTTTGDQFWPSVAIDGQGNIVAAWSDLSGGASSTEVFSRRFDSTGNPVGDEIQVNTYTQSNQESAMIAADSSGNYIVVWDSYNQDGSEWGVIGQRYLASGTPIGKEFQVNTTTNLGQRYSWVSMNSTGDFVVVWASDGQDGSGNGIFGQRYNSNGETIGSEFQVNTHTDGDQYIPSVSMNSDGKFVVAWCSIDQDGSLWGVFGQAFDSNGMPVGNEFQVNSYTEGTQFSPEVAMDSAGNFVVVWTSDMPDGSRTIIGRRFDATVNPLSGEFRIDTRPDGMPGQPSIAMDASGRFIVTWENGEPGSYDIAAQRFNAQGEARGREAW